MAYAATARARRPLLRKGAAVRGLRRAGVAFDPARRVTLSAASHHSRADYNLFEAIEVTAAPDVVLRRGEVLVEGDRLVAAPGSGRFVRRARAGEELFNRAAALS